MATACTKLGLIIITIIIIMIIIMEICKAPTLRLKALNKHSITHIMYIEMEMISAIKMYVRKKKKKKANTYYFKTDADL